MRRVLCGVRTLALACFVLVAACAWWCSSALYVQAQTAISYTVTPPLFQLNLDPGTTWSSSVKVVNGNAFPLTVYADPVPFEPEGESGRPRFDIASLEGGVDDIGLASWITVPGEAIEVPPESTVEIPLRFTIPQDAAPGGHYAAILIGNRADKQDVEGSAVSVQSAIASLIFLSVSGDVVEKARIRDFVTEQSLYERPEARLSLRFENQGNVHIQPKGDITIFNMFGKVRGRIDINQGQYFGNVLPGSIRKFTFDWQADSGMWDIGRYRAQATLGYGKDAKQFATATTYFYVLPVGPLLQILGAAALVVWLLFFSIRAYIRKALALEAERHGIYAHTPASHNDQSTPQTEVAPRQSTIHQEPQERAPAPLELRTLVRPLERGMVDLRRVTRGAPATTPDSRAPGSLDGSAPHDVVSFLKTYRWFFMFVVLVAAGWFVAGTLIDDVFTYERPYDVTVVDEEDPLSTDNQ